MTTPYIELLSSEEIIKDGQTWVSEIWLKSMWPSPLERLRQYPAGTVVKETPSKNDSWLVLPT